MKILIISALLMLQGIGGKGGIGGNGGIGGGTSVAVPAILQFGLNSTGFTPYVASLPNHATGGLSVVIAALAVGGSSPTIANTASFTWTLVASNTSGNGGYNQYAWTAPTASFGSTDTVTITTTASPAGMVFADVSNVTTLDTFSSLTSVGFSNITTGAVTVTGPNDMAIGITNPHGGGVIGSGMTSFTAGGTGLWGNDAYNLAEYGQFTGTPITVTGGAATGWDFLVIFLK